MYWAKCVGSGKTKKYIPKKRKEVGRVKKKNGNDLNGQMIGQYFYIRFEQFSINMHADMPTP